MPPSNLGDMAVSKGKGKAVARGSDDNDEDLAAENARLHKEIKHFCKQLEQVHRYCEREGIRDIMTTNTTPGASGSCSQSQVSRCSIRELSVLHQENGKRLQVSTIDSVDVKNPPIYQCLP
ncbi:hypothetical protein FRC10_000813 [Ceratobasidium sp. 414]|nr:hypothetical protein FRC10_000813 [Ceratobasidium sp. 414]